MTTVTRSIHFARKARRKVLKTGPPPQPPAPCGRIPRVSKLMALAIRFDRILANGEVASMSDLARLACVTQPRMTQIMNLLHLAPDIQEELLFLRQPEQGRDLITERDLRSVAGEIRWTVQRSLWHQVKPRKSESKYS